MPAHLYARTHAATRATHGVPALRARLTWPCVAEAASVADARVAELALGYCPSLFWVGLGEANELLKGGGVTWKKLSWQRTAIHKGTGIRLMCILFRCAHSD